jgi:hypothetical protein
MSVRVIITKGRRRSRFLGTIAAEDWSRALRIAHKGIVSGGRVCNEALRVIGEYEDISARQNERAKVDSSPPFERRKG